MQFLMLAVQKSSFLCDIVATAFRIGKKTQNYMLLYKLRKHLAEQSQCKNKVLCKVMDPESKLKSLDTDLLRAKGYHNLENRNVKHIPANVNLLELRNYASLIEQETAADSNIITKNPNKQEKIDFLLKPFPVMSALHLGNLILIIIHDFHSNKHNFKSLLYLEEDEADEAPPEKVYMKKVFGPSKNVVENTFIRKILGLNDMENNSVKQHLLAAHGQNKTNRGRFTT